VLLRSSANAQRLSDCGRTTHVAIMYTFRRHVKQRASDSDLSLSA
jgi:hypothetical protein